MNIALSIDTDDDDTLDRLLELLEDFARGPVRSLLNSADPLAIAMVATSEGDATYC